MTNILRNFVKTQRGIHDEFKHVLIWKTVFMEEILVLWPAAAEALTWSRH